MRRPSHAVADLVWAESVVSPYVGVRGGGLGLDAHLYEWADTAFYRNPRLRHVYALWVASPLRKMEVSIMTRRQWVRVAIAVPLAIGGALAFWLTWSNAPDTWRLPFLGFFFGGGLGWVAMTWALELWR